MIKIFSISAMAAGMLLASCNDIEPNAPQEEANDPNAIQFALSQDEASSRTQYAQDDWLQIEWVKDDLVNIWCKPENEKLSSATYKVTNVTAKSKATITPIGSWLSWGKTSNKHTFCGIYGEKVLYFSLMSDGQATARLQYPLTQTLEKVNGSWVNMKQAYMVAYATYSQKAESVNLNFQPIMTTLDVVVKGMAAGEGAEPIKVKSLSVETVEGADVICEDEKGNKYFDIKFSPSNDPSASRYTITTDDAYCQEARTITFELATPQEVAVDGSLLITAILPSIEISEAKPVTITVTTDDDTSKSFKFSGPVSAGNKAKIETKPWSTQQSTVPEGAVDMGLSVYWAESALKPNSSSSRADAYSYYGWGCTTPYSGTYNPDYEWKTYFNILGLNGLQDNQYFYACGRVDYDPLANYANKPDQYPLAGSEHDIAYKSTSGKWRMPTKDDWEELLNTDNCTWVRQDTGYKVTSKKNGNSIFLPAAGVYDGKYGSSLVNLYSGYGYYWSATPDADSNGSTTSAWCLEFTNGNSPKLSKELRCKAYTILPVAAK